MKNYKNNAIEPLRKNVHTAQLSNGVPQMGWAFNVNMHLAFF